MLARIHEEMVWGLKHLDVNTRNAVIAAYVDYQLYWIEPSQDDILVYSIFKAKQFDLDSIVRDIKASVENGRKGWRTKKTFKNLKEPKGILKQPKDNLKESKQNLSGSEKEKEKEKEKEQDNNIILYNNIISNTESKDSDINNITSNINKLISELKEESNSLGIVYDKKDERNFSKHILTAKDFWAFAEKIWQSRNEFARNIMRASVLIHFWKGVCSWPKLIYQNYAEVYNKSLQEHAKQQKNKIYSF